MLDTLRNFGVPLKEVWRYERRAGSADQLTATVCWLWYSFEQLLVKRGVFDFPLVIEAATRALTSHTRLRANSYQHVLVDESQDAAGAELALLAELEGSLKTLTHVGDALQALYGWRGAVVPDRQNFTRLWLKKNYRSDAHILATANEFVKKTLGRPNYLESTKEARRRPTVIVHGAHAEAAILGQLMAELKAKGYAPSDILVLGRTNAAIFRVKRVAAAFAGLRVLTVHAAKGLEAPVVIILNVDGSRFGFPQPKQRASGILSQLASYDHDQEECYVFYVAMTRARKLLILLTADQKSAYVGMLHSLKIRKT
jgi:superfamily I DNA/RNA helicase